MRSTTKVTRKLKQRRYSRAIENNLLGVYAQATADELIAGRSWYRQAHTIASSLAVRFNITISQAAGVIAALSPSRFWSANVADAQTLISAWKQGLRGTDLPKVGTYGQANRDKASNILSGIDPLSVLGGQKVQSFYRNILNPDSNIAVTIDRHAKSAALGVSLADSEINIGAPEYRSLSRQYLVAASKVGLLGNEFQAIVWVVWRRLKGIEESLEVAA